MTSLLMLKKILQRIERENQNEKVWIVGPKTGHFLYWLVRVVRPEFVVEIGTSVGYSALWLAAALEENAWGELWTVESHADRFERARQNISESNLTHRIHQLKGHAPEIFLEANGPLPERIDFAFYDATKKTTRDFYEAVLPRMKSGSMVVVDNVQSHRAGELEKFIEAVHQDQRVKVVEIPVGDGLLIARIV